MWFWLVVIIMVMAVGLIVLGNINWDYGKHKFLSYHDEFFNATGWVVGTIALIACLIMSFVIIDAHTNVEARIEECRETYDALTYKMESTTCRDEFGFLSKEVIDEVQEWNKDVRYYQAIQDNFWNGIFYPNVYDEFVTIDYESYNGG